LIKPDYTIPYFIKLSKGVYELHYRKVTMIEIEKIAKVAHLTNKAWCEVNGDFSQPSWEDAPEWQRSSIINGVKFHIENPDASPSASHDAWLKEKRENGWAWGPEKDPDKKLHPCFTEYENLPTNQKVKDYLFKNVVRTLIDHS